MTLTNRPAGCASCRWNRPTRAGRQALTDQTVRNLQRHDTHWSAAARPALLRHSPHLQGLNTSCRSSACQRGDSIRRADLQRFEGVAHRRLIVVGTKDLTGDGNSPCMQVVDRRTGGTLVALPARRVVTGSFWGIVSRGCARGLSWRVRMLFGRSRVQRRVVGCRGLVGVVVAAGAPAIGLNRPRQRRASGL